MRGGGKPSSIRSRCLKFHNFVPSDAASESTRLQEQHGTKKITVTSTPWLPTHKALPNSSECPVPVGGIVPSAAPLPQHLLAFLLPAPPITHLTPEVTITPVPTSTSLSQHSTSRKRKSDDVRRLLNIKISLKEQRKRDEQPLDLSLKKDDEAAEQLRIACSESGVPAALARPVPMYPLLGPHPQPALASVLCHHHNHHHHHHHHPRAVSERSALPTLGNFSQYTDLAHQTANGILVKTKQVSEGDATFCKFRQVKPPARPPGRQKKLNFMPSKWPQ